MKRLMNAVILLLGLSMAMMTSCTKDPDNGGNGGNNGGGNNGNTYNGHEYVDLGLPSGTIWATCNVGADTPEDYGDYFAWGETASKDYYDWSTYKYSNNGSWGNSNLIKYCNNSSYGYNGFTDNLIVLQAMDDAATANWGNGWRMPTKEEWEELENNTSNTYTTRNDIYGWLFTASNGNSLFLPAAGYRRNDVSDGLGSRGFYGSSSLVTDKPDRSWRFDFFVLAPGMEYVSRISGLPVRAVRSTH